MKILKFLERLGRIDRTVSQIRYVSLVKEYLTEAFENLDAARRLFDKTGNIDSSNEVEKIQKKLVKIMKRNPPPSGAKG